MRLPRGKDAISAFWDKQIGPNRICFNITDSYACGQECANVGSLTITMDGGLVTVVNGVFVYRVNDAGAVVSLRAFWEFDGIQVIPPA